jgi:hypothetical protein
MHSYPHRHKIRVVDFIVVMPILRALSFGLAFGLQNLRIGPHKELEGQE